MTADNANVPVPLTCFVLPKLHPAAHCLTKPGENNWDGSAVALRMLCLCPSPRVAQHGKELGDLLVPVMTLANS